MSTEEMSGNKWSQLKRQGMWTANNKAISVGLPTPSGAYIPPYAPDARHGSLGFNVCPDGFWSCFGSIPISMPHSSLL
jgi:hypothetical protein